VKLEIGSGQRPEPGYVHTDITKQNDVELDRVAPGWELDYPDNSFQVVLALGTIEHMRYKHAQMTFKNVRRMLETGGAFLFDVPNIVQWCRYLANLHAGYTDVPFSEEHILATLYGWQRWDGDEHKSGWSGQLLEDALFKAGFTKLRWGVDVMLERGIERRRMTRPEDAHYYLECR
jgi:predicted SAM-dependent methyltransferase